MRSCERHPYRYSMCADCDEANPPPVRRDNFFTYHPYQLTGLQKTYLDTVRSRITADDTIPLLRWEELIDAIERSVSGEVE